MKTKKEMSNNVPIRCNAMLCHRSDRAHFCPPVCTPLMSSAPFSSAYRLAYSARRLPPDTRPYDKKHTTHKEKRRKHQHQKKQKSLIP